MNLIINLCASSYFINIWMYLCRSIFQCYKYVTTAKIFYFNVTSSFTNTVELNNFFDMLIIYLLSKYCYKHMLLNLFDNVNTFSLFFQNHWFIFLVKQIWDIGNKWKPHPEMICFHMMIWTNNKTIIACWIRSIRCFIDLINMWWLYSNLVYLVKLS